MSVKLTRNFGVEGLGELIKEAKELFNLGIPESFKRELIHGLAHSKLGWGLASVRKK